MDEAKNYLSGLPLGEDWVSCIEAWVKLETALEYGAKTKGVLPEAKMRPEEWSKWVAKKRGGSRAYHLVPDLVRALDIEDFGVAFVKWWHRMQPSFRHRDNILPAEVYTLADGNNDDIWARLHKGGPSGLVSVLTMLGWWGRGGSADPNWKAATIDIRRVLECMTAASMKRAGEDLEQDSARKR
ncbi:hypothetical protein BD779DRAFT_1451980 [Infundibulicybe gibba]|nr:hypothetical protein BD779DRAFT_1451980 [Infundibulicybe gibba]